MIPVVAPPLVEPRARLRRFRAHQEYDDRATQPSPRRSVPAVLMCLGAAAGLAAAMIRHKHEGASS